MNIFGYEKLGPVRSSVSNSNMEVYALKRARIQLEVRKAFIISFALIG